jgi:hypothetical protein
MGMYGDILNKLDTGQFVKLEPGKPMRLRILDHPHVSYRQFREGEQVTTRFSWPVWDYALKQVRILEQGKSVFKEIATAVETWPNGEVMPAPFDVVITRKGTGQFDTEYSVTPLPHDGSMPNSGQLDLPDMAEKTGGIPLKQVYEGQEPEVKRIGDTQGQAALPAGERDVVIQDLDATQPVNLDEIPF